MSEYGDLKKMSVCDKDPIGCVGVILGFFFLYVHYELIPTALYVERVYMEIGHTYSECIYTCNFCNPQGSGGQECRHG